MGGLNRSPHHRRLSDSDSESWRTRTVASFRVKMLAPESVRDRNAGHGPQIGGGGIDRHRCIGRCGHPSRIWPSANRQPANLPDLLPPVIGPEKAAQERAGCHFLQAVTARDQKGIRFLPLPGVAPFSGEKTTSRRTSARFHRPAVLGCQMLVRLQSGHEMDRLSWHRRPEVPPVSSQSSTPCFAPAKRPTRRE